MLTNIQGRLAPAILLLACLALPLSAQTAQVSTFLSVLPADHATAVPLNASVIATFQTQALYSGNYSIKLTSGGLLVQGSTLATNGTTIPAGQVASVQFVPAKPLAPNTTYSVEIDLLGVAPVLTTFTTGSTVDVTPFTLVAASPAQGQSSVNTQTPASLQFNRPASPFSSTPYNGVVLDLGTGQYTTNAANFNLGAEGALKLNMTLTLGHSYQLELSKAGLTDWLGNQLSLATPIVFSTLMNPSSDGPQLTGTAPTQGQSHVPTNSAIALVFDRPLAPLSYQKEITVTAGGPVAFTADASLAQGRLLTIQPTGLLPPNTQVTVQVTGLLDTTGSVFAGPMSFQFTTDQGPSYVRQTVTSSQFTVFPQNAPLTIRLALPLRAELLALGSVAAGGLVFPWQLSADGKTLTLLPVSPLPPGSYTVQINQPFDLLLGKVLSPPAFSFTVTAGTDNTLPQISSVTPPAGSSDIPLRPVMQVLFNKPVATPADSSAPIRLMSNGSSVGGSFNLAADGLSLSFFAAAPLAASTTFQLMVSGLTDITGQQIADFSTSFTTIAVASTTPPLQVTAMSPADGTTQVDPSVPIVLTFNRPVNPNSANATTLSFSYSPFPGTQLPGPNGTYSVAGNTVTFTPNSPLPAGKFYLTVHGVTDLSGSALGYLFSSFQVQTPSAPAASTAVTLVSPGNGQIVSSDGYVVISFSQSLAPDTVVPGNFTVYPSYNTLTVQLLPGGTQVALRFSAKPSTLVTIQVNSSVTDWLGNAVIPYQTTVKTADSQSLSPAFLTAAIPANSSVVSPDTSINLIFTGALDRQSVESAFIAAANGTAISGSFRWAADSASFSFTPNQRLPYGATVAYALGPTAHDALGNRVIAGLDTFGYAPFSTTAAPPSSDSLAILSPHDFPFLPANGVIDLEFNGPVPASLVTGGRGVLQARNYQLQPTGQPIACTAQLIGNNVLRFHPDSQPLPAKTSIYYYSFDFDSRTGLTWSGNVYFTSDLLPPNPSVIGHGAVGSAVGLNSRVVMGFTSSINPVAIAGKLTLSANGVNVPASYSFSTRTVVLTPLTLLQPDTDYLVTASGLDDPAGQSIPDMSWIFHTGFNADITPPQLLYSDPSGTWSSPNAPLSLYFSKPVAAGLAEIMLPVPQGKFYFSDDQTAFTIVPPAPAAIGHQIVAQPSPYSSITDFAGNSIGISTLPALPKAGPGPFPAPSVVTSAPFDASVNVPLNAQLQLYFDQTVRAASLSNISVLESGNPVDFTSRLDSDGRTVTFIPSRLPAQGANYTITVSGVQNSEGTVMATPFQYSFQMGANTKTAPATCQSSPATAQNEVPVNVQLRIRCDTQLNGVSVARSSLVLSAITPLRISSSLQDAGNTLLLTPLFPLSAATNYTLDLKSITDITGNIVSGLTFNTSTGVDLQPAKLLSYDPADGSDFPASGRPSFLYSQPVDATLGANTITLQGPAGQVTGMFTTARFNAGNQFTFQPAQPLAPGTYQLSVKGVTDVAGNPLQDVATSFHVSNGPADFSSLVLVSGTPLQGAAGVPVNSTITLTFNRPVTSVSAGTLNVLDSAYMQIPGKFVTTGNSIVFTPASFLSAASYIIVSGNLADAYGNGLTIQYGFKTGAASDTTAPTLINSYPANGSTIPADRPLITLRFSKPISSSSLAQGIQLVTNRVIQQSPTYLSEDGATLQISTFGNATPGDTVTVSITPALKDLQGNPAQAATVKFTVASDAIGAPYVKAISPAHGAANVPLNTPVTLTFSKPMDIASTTNDLLVSNAGIRAGGSWLPDAGAQSFTFTQAASWLPGSSVETFLFGTGYDAAGSPLSPGSWTFTTASASQPSAQVIDLSASPDAVDVRFQGSVPLNLGNAYLREGLRLIPTQIAATGPDQIRFVPAEHLQAQTSYSLIIDAKQEFPLSFENASPEIPVGSVQKVDAEGFHLQFSHPVNHLTLRNGGLAIRRPDGSAVAFTMKTSADAKAVVVTPLERKPETLHLELKQAETKDGKPVTRFQWTPQAAK